MQRQPTLPRYPRIFATVTAVLTGLGILPAIGIVAIVGVIAYPNLRQQWASEGELTALEIAGAAGIFGLLIGYVVFVVVFFVSSIGLLRLRKSALLPYKVCLFTYMTLCILAFTTQFVPIMMLSRSQPLVVGALIGAVILLIGVLVIWLCFKMVRYLGRPDLLERFKEHDCA